MKSKQVRDQVSKIMFMSPNFYRRVLIDSGDEHTASEYINLLKGVLLEENATIEHLIVTHWHHDHIGGVSAVQKLLQLSNPESSPAIVWKFPRLPGDPGREDDEKSVEVLTSLKVITYFS